MESKILFDINNLISSTIESRIGESLNEKEKLSLLFNLIDYNYYFSAEVINEIDNFYLEKTGERYSPVLLSEDDKEFIFEYASYFTDLDSIKRIINGLANNISRENTIIKAHRKIESEIERRKAALKEKTTKLYDNISFDDDNSSESDNEKDENYFEKRSPNEIFDLINNIMGKQE